MYCREWSGTAAFHSIPEAGSGAHRRRIASHPRRAEGLTSGDAAIPVGQRQLRRFIGAICLLEPTGNYADVAVSGSDYVVATPCMKIRGARRPHRYHSESRPNPGAETLTSSAKDRAT